MIRSLRHVRLVSLVAALATAILAALPVRADDASVRAQSSVNVGIEGRLIYRYPGELRPRPFSAKSPVVVRVASTTNDGNATLYDLRFIGVKPGKFDLRDAIEKPDGASVGDGPAAVVEILSILPEDHDGLLIGAKGLGLPRIGGYRLLLIIVGVLWVIPLVWVIVRRLTRKKPLAQLAVTQGPPTLADQLRPLVEAAIAGRATPDELARLERLLIAHWGDRLMLGDLPMHEAVLRLKAHDEGGQVLRQVESWLHSPRGQAEHEPDVSAMLAPYRTGKWIDIHANGQAPSTANQARAVVAAETAGGGAV